MHKKLTSEGQYTSETSVFKDRNTCPVEAKLSISRANRAMDAAAALLAVLIGLIALRVFFAHLNDLYLINFVSGAWLAQANEAMHGTPYPELFNGERVGGTRFMIIPIAMHAALAWILDISGMARPEALLVAGRLLSLLSTSALLYMVYRIGLRFGTPRGFAALAAAAILLTSPGQLALLSIRYDAPSAALQLGALLWATAKRPRWIWIGVILGIAIFCKANAAWVGLGLTAWLLAKDRRALGQLYIGGISCVVAISLAAYLWTDGRFWDNIIGLTFSGEGEVKRGLIGSLQAIGQYWIKYAKLSLLLLPLSLLGWFLLILQWREGAPYTLAAGWGILIAWYSYNDIGVSYNHLLDILSFVSLGVAAAAAWAKTRTWWVYSGVWAGLVFVSLAAIATGHITKEAIKPGETIFDITNETRAVIADIPEDDGRPIFANDPYIPIMVGERPEVMDMFMLHRISRNDPKVMASIVERINTHAFRALVLPEGYLENPRMDPTLIGAISTR
ncbi:MAG: hypothetical protein AB8C95_09815, partial [Phycisphaeraceae bacterium]